jgi:hypothetical protein
MFSGLISLRCRDRVYLIEVKGEKMKRLLLLPVVLFLSVSVWGQGAFQNGEKMAKHCTVDQRSAFEDGVCMGYIISVVDTLAWTVALEALEVPYCLPEGVAPEQLKEVVIKYLKENPERLKFASPPLIVAAFTEAYPCPEE